MHRAEKRIPAFVCVLLAGIGALAGNAPAESKQEAGNEAVTVWDGVFTTGQAARGRTDYQNSCAHCHGSNLTGGSAPSLSGDSFMERWREYNLSSLFLYMKDLMPRDRPGSLSDSVHLDVLAYVLQVNEFPAGDQQLAGEILGNVRIVGEDGPQPLSNNTLITVVGCLAATDDDGWSLTRASEPARASSGYETSPGELDAARGASLGAGSFELLNFEFLFPPFEPGPYAGHKLLVKGALFREERGNRIFTAAVEPVADQCENP